MRQQFRVLHHQMTKMSQYEIWLILWLIKRKQCCNRNIVLLKLCANERSWQKVACPLRLCTVSKLLGIISTRFRLWWKTILGTVTYCPTLDASVPNPVPNLYDIKAKVGSVTDQIVNTTCLVNTNHVTPGMHRLSDWWKDSKLVGSDKQTPNVSAWPDGSVSDSEPVTQPQLLLKIPPDVRHLKWLLLT